MVGQQKTEREREGERAWCGEGVNRCGKSEREKGGREREKLRKKEEDRKMRDKSRIAIFGYFRKPRTDKFWILPPAILGVTFNISWATEYVQNEDFFFKEKRNYKEKFANNQKEAS